MRWIRFVLAAALVLFGAYTLLMYYFVEESKQERVERVVPYPLEKVFPQYSNLQNFTRWNTFFSNAKKLSVQYYAPYEGQGAAMSYINNEDGSHGELAIRYMAPGKGIKYQFFETEKANPMTIDVKFTPLSAGNTKISYLIRTARQPLLKRYTNLMIKENFEQEVDRSLASLKNVLSNRVEKESQLAAIKYDSLMVENLGANLLLGVNVSSSNKKDALIKNIVLNHHKVYNFITTDLGKREEEFGLPVMISDPLEIKNKEISYFYGIPLSKKVSVADNNFSFRNTAAGKAYVIYYRGPYAARTRAIQQLMQRARRDTMRYGAMEETFLEEPREEGLVNLKIVLPVQR